MVSNKDFKRWHNLQVKYGVLYEANADLNERFTKLQAEYDKLKKGIKNDLKFLELNWLKDTPIIEGLKKKYGLNDPEELLKELAYDLEPKTHCCECTPGENFERHLVHIQYPNCNCNPEKYVLKRND